VLECNDWYGSANGVVYGTIPGISDVTVYPFFCDLSRDDVYLSAGSPLLNLGACGLIGALGEGCTEAVGVPPALEPGVHAFTASPNPSGGIVRFSWASSARPEKLEVIDGTGARRWSAANQPGASALAWPGLDSAGRRLPAGVYYARLTSKSTSATARFVLV
jgi:hypothetical protein